MCKLSKYIMSLFLNQNVPLKNAIRVANPGNDEDIKPAAGFDRGKCTRNLCKRIQKFKGVFY